MWFSLVVCILMLLLVVRATYNALKAFTWSTEMVSGFSQTSWSNDCSLPHFYLLIPALREQAVIERTLSRLVDLNFPVDSFDIILALDLKEKPNKDGVTTFDVATRFIKARQSFTGPSISIVIYSGDGRMRSLQLNEALKFVKERVDSSEQDPTKVFVGVYDADSFPSKEVLHYIHWRLGVRPDLCAFQQTLDYRLNIDEILDQRFPWLLWGNAIYQTAWNTLSEVPSFLRMNTQLGTRKPASFPPYCMGHGEFIRLDVLQQVGGFSTDGAADGIQIGYSLSVRSIEIEPVPFADYCESPVSHVALIHQHSLWFAGTTTFFRYATSDSGLSVVVLKRLVNQTIEMVKWLTCPFWIVSALLILAVEALRGQPWAAILLPSILLLLLAYSNLVLSVVIRNYDVNLPKDRRSQVWLAPFWILVAIGYRSLGGILGLIKMLRAFAQGISPSFRKIERLGDSGK